MEGAALGEEERIRQARILVAIPAYNEEASIEQVVAAVRRFLPDIDLLVVDDGSQDQTAAKLQALGVRAATHVQNLGYGRAIQTAIKYALRNRYDALVTLDADGQHHPEQVRQMIAVWRADEWDCLIGSRYVASRSYAGSPLGRRLGMVLFSILTQAFTGRRIYDTTSGLKIFRHTVFRPLTQWHFVDFHAETIVFLARLGFRLSEHAITVSERRHGVSMYSLISHFVYPLQTLLMMVIGAVEAEITRKRRPI